MKFISRILAIYILALAIMPCNDIHAIVQTNSNELVITQVNAEHNHDFDFCSPFCSCDCCHTIAEPVVIDMIQIDVELSQTSVLPYFIAEKESFYTFWRPPIM